MQRFAGLNSIEGWNLTLQLSNKEVLHDYKELECCERIKIVLRYKIVSKERKTANERIYKIS